MDGSRGLKPIKVDYQLVRNGLREPEPERASLIARSGMMLTMVALLLIGLNLMPTEAVQETSRSASEPSALARTHSQPQRATSFPMTARQILPDSRTR
jgi:hypothetical protein